MISILISSRNPDEKYICECLDSIYKQTYKDFEIVLIDDGSEKMISNEKYINKYDERLKIYRINQSNGLASALNYGVARCNGKYIARMDDDDIMTEDRLQKQFELLEKSNNKYVASFSWFDRIDSDGNFVKTNKIKIESNKFMKQLLTKGNIFCHSTLFIKKDILQELGGYDVNLKYAQDNDLYIRILEKYNIGMVEDVLLKSRINNYRNDKYRETLSLTYALFGVLKHFSCGNNVKKTQKKYMIFRIIFFIKGYLDILKK